MKNSVWFIALIGLAISSCTSQKQATSYVNDEVYGTPSPQTVTHVAPVPEATKGAQVITAPDKASVSKPGSSTFADDYNDYSYASRIERFNNKDTTKGYFSDEYASSSGDGGGTSSSPNVNVFLGFGAGYGGYYGSSFGFGFGWGYPYSYWGYDYGWWNPYPYYGWGYPYYGWGYPYYGYYPWYSPCCYCYGYYDGYYGGYPPYSTTSGYYGRRESLYGSDLGASGLNTRNTQDINASLTSPNSRTQEVPAYSRSATTGTANLSPSARSTPASQEKYSYTRSVNNKQAPNQRAAPKTQQQSQVRTQPSPKYIRPENAATIQRSGSAQSYSSPVYRQPKTSQEYLTPRVQNPVSTRVSNGENRSFSGAAAGTIDNTRVSPSTGINRSGNNTGRNSSSGYSNPVRSSNTYSAPARSSGRSESYSAPSRSGGSSPSAPSGGGNYSAPSRSSGGGGSSPSSGGGGGGRRR